MSQTTIQISKETREKLKKFGRKGETYDEVIKNLIEISRKAMFFNELDRITDTEEFIPLEKI
jgi:predicted CopG family antitoxin